MPENDAQVGAADGARGRRLVLAIPRPVNASPAAGGAADEGADEGGNGPADEAAARESP